MSYLLERAKDDALLQRIVQTVQQGQPVDKVFEDPALDETQLRNCIMFINARVDALFYERPSRQRNYQIHCWRMALEAAKQALAKRQAPQNEHSFTFDLTLEMMSRINQAFILAKS